MIFIIKDTALAFLEEQAEERQARGGRGLERGLERGTLLPALERLLLAMVARNRCSFLDLIFKMKILQ